MGLFGKSTPEPIRSDMSTARHRRTATTAPQNTGTGRTARAKVQRIAKHKSNTK